MQMKFFAAAAALVFCGSVAAQDTVKIGVVQPLTGPVAYDGNIYANTVKMLVDDMNAKGGVLGKKIELVIEDGACNPAQSVNAAEKLVVRDKVVALLGAFCSTSTAAMMEVARKHKIPHITGVSSAAQLTEQNNPYFFRALAVADSAGITVEKGYALNNIAAVFMHEGENERALDYAHRSLALQEKVQDKRAIAYAHSRLAEILNASKRYDEAILESQRSYAAWQGLHVTSNAMTAVRDRGLAYEGKGQYADALREFVQIIESDSVSAGTKLNVDNDLARVYLRQREPDKAIAVGLA